MTDLLAPEIWEKSGSMVAFPLSVGDHVRIVRLRSRPGGVLSTTPRTVLLRTGDLPDMTLGTHKLDFKYTTENGK